MAMEEKWRAEVVASQDIFNILIGAEAPWNSASIEVSANMQEVHQLGRNQVRA